MLEIKKKEKRETKRDKRKGSKDKSWLRILQHSKEILITKKDDSREKEKSRNVRKIN
jgi:hypothetical protein